MISSSGSCPRTFCSWARDHCLAEPQTVAAAFSNKARRFEEFHEFRCCSATVNVAGKETTDERGTASVFRISLHTTVSKHCMTFSRLAMTRPSEGSPHRSAEGPDQGFMYVLRGGHRLTWDVLFAHFPSIPGSNLLYMESFGHASFDPRIFP